MATHTFGTLVRLLMAVALACAGLVWSPMAARACACGAVVDRDGASVTGETAIVSWNGTTEQIDMALTLTRSVDDAAWIMPTPRDTTLGLGDRAHFAAVAKASEPRRERRGVFALGFSGGDRASGAAPGSGQTGAPVSIEAVTEVGPFRVTTISGDDASAVNTWLTEQGYPTKPAIVPVLGQYLAKGWVIQAVKLAPAAGSTLPKSLTPLRMTFDIDEPVYPIALSSQAVQSQWVTLYLVGPQSLTVTGQGRVQSQLGLQFSGQVPASTVGRTGDPLWLTTLSGRMSPSDLTQDFTIEVEQNPSPYQRVIFTEVRWGEQLVSASVGVIVVGSVLSLVTGVVLLIVKAARGPAPRL